MGAKMEVLPNSLLKRRGSSTATWGGGTLGRVGGRRRKRGAEAQFTTTTSCSAACGRPSCLAASHTGLQQQHHAVQPVVGRLPKQFLTQRVRCPRSWPCNRLVTRPWRRLGMEGPEDDGGEGNLGRVEKNTKRAESNIAPPTWCDFNKRK